MPTVKAYIVAVDLDVVSFRPEFREEVSRLRAKSPWLIDEALTFLGKLVSLDVVRGQIEYMVNVSATVEKEAA